jgi:hypothetical protein
MKLFKWYKRKREFGSSEVTSYFKSTGEGKAYYLLYRENPIILSCIRFESKAEERYAGQKTGLTTWKVTPVVSKGKNLELIEPPKISEDDCRKFFRWIWWAEL